MASGDFEENAYHLASQAYLLASRKSPDNAEKQRLLKKASGMVTHAQWTDAEASRQLDKGLAKGIQLSEKVARDEAQWIAEGRDASALFLSKYFK